MSSRSSRPSYASRITRGDELGPAGREHDAAADVGDDLRGLAVRRRRRRSRAGPRRGSRTGGSARRSPRGRARARRSGGSRARATAAGPRAAGTEANRDLVRLEPFGEADEVSHVPRAEADDHDPRGRRGRGGTSTRGRASSRFCAWPTLPECMTTKAAAEAAAPRSTSFSCSLRRDRVGVDPVRDHADALAGRALRLEPLPHRLADRDYPVGALEVETRRAGAGADEHAVLEPPQLRRDLGEHVLADHEQRHAEALGDREADVADHRRVGHAEHEVGSRAASAPASSELPMYDDVVEPAQPEVASARTPSRRRGRSRPRSALLAFAAVLVPVQDAGQHADLVLVREGLAELGEQLRRRLDAGPVVLVDDEQARLPGQAQPRLRRLTSSSWRAAVRASSSPRPRGGRRPRSAGRSSSTRELTKRLAERGHTVEVVTTSLTASTLRQRGHSRSRGSAHDGVRVHYLATPVQLPLDGDHADAARRARAGCRAARRRARLRLPRPRDDGRLRVGARTRGPVRLRATRDVPARGCGRSALKRALDATLYAASPRGAAAVVVSLELEARRRRRGRAWCRASGSTCAGTAFPAP